MTATSVKSEGRVSPYPTWLVLLGLLVVAGLAGWIIQLVQGLVVTDMRNVTVWGLYIVSFMFFVGLSAGGLIVSSATKVFKTTRFDSIAKIATLLSFSCIVAAAVSILPDMGRPERLWHMIIHPNFQSPLVWDMIIIGIYAALSAVYLWMMIRHDRGAISSDALRRMAFFALPTAILVHSVTAWIFGLQVSHPFWNSALMAPLFISSALVSGTALLMIAVLWLKRIGYLEFSGSQTRSLGALLSVFIVVDLFFLFSEIITEAYPQAAEGTEALELLITGAGAPMFWAEVLLGGVVALYLLLSRRTREQPGWVVLASVFVIIGIFFKRFNLLMAGFRLPLVSAEATVQTGPVSPNADTLLQTLEEGLGYFPSAVEWAIFGGVIALTALIFTLGVRYLPLGSVPEEEAGV